MTLFKAAAAGAVLALISSCAAVSQARDEVIAGFCGVRAGETWSRIDAPADAAVYRQLAADDPSRAGRRPRGDEYWFARGDEEVRFCVTPLQRARFVPARNRSGCDERIGVWWDFRRTGEGPGTAGADEHICVT